MLFDLITEEEKKKINWDKVSWCKSSDLIIDDGETILLTFYE